MRQRTEEPRSPAATPPLAPIAVNLERARNSGTIIAGNDNLNVDNRGGTIILPPRPMRPVLRSPPLHLFAPPPPGTVGRERLAAQIRDDLTDPRVEIFGPDGVGKTTLISVVLDGLDHWNDIPIVYVDGTGLETDAVLARVAHALYDFGEAVSPAPEALVTLLHEPEALVILDHVDESPARVEVVERAVSGALFSASTARTLYAHGRARPVAGLHAEAARALVERGLGRSLDAEELPGADAVAVEVRGHPERLARAGAIVAAAAASFDELLAALRSGVVEPLEAVDELPATEEQAQVLLLLAAVAGVPLGLGLLGRITAGSGTESVLERLRDAGLVRAHSPRYSLPPAVPPGLVGSPRRGDRLVEHVAEEVEAWSLQASPQEILRDTATVVALAHRFLAEGSELTAFRLARAAFLPLLVGGQWTALEGLLERVREVATGEAELWSAWAAHELGALAVVLDRPQRARWLFEEALAVRRGAGNEVGAVATATNLALLDQREAERTETSSAADVGRSASAGAVGAVGADAADKAKAEEEEPPELTMGS